MNTIGRSYSEILVEKTEAFLSYRKRKRRRKHEKLKKKNVILDWIEAFLWAAAVVLVVNQYVLQAYQIPTGSMIDTLLEQDRVFVNKFVYGPELLPGLMKLPGLARPERNEVIIFENPAYLSRGPVFEILQRIIYMVTLSTVDINRDEFGRPRAQFLIKRAVGVEHDRFRMRDGTLEIRPHGEPEWMTEARFQEIAGITYPVNRLMDPGSYPVLKQAGIAAGYRDLGIPAGFSTEDALSAANRVRYPDGFYIDMWRTQLRFSVNPHDTRLRSRSQVYEMGWYVPENRVFTLGDNRDNSLDARSFGPVHENRVLGKGMIKYWPPGRIGPIR
jgi:signal peptidase I